MHYRQKLHFKGLTSVTNNVLLYTARSYVIVYHQDPTLCSFQSFWKLLKLSFHLQLEELHPKLRPSLYLHVFLWHLSHCPSALPCLFRVLVCCNNYHSVLSDLSLPHFVLYSIHCVCTISPATLKIEPSLVTNMWTVACADTAYLALGQGKHFLWIILEPNVNMILAAPHNGHVSGLIVECLNSNTVMSVLLYLWHTTHGSFSPCVLV